MGTVEFGLCELSGLLEQILFYFWVVVGQENLCVRRDENWKKGCVGWRSDGHNQASHIALAAKYW